MENRQRHVNYQKSQGIEQHNKRKKNKRAATIIKKICPYRARKNF